MRFLQLLGLGLAFIAGSVQASTVHVFNSAGQLTGANGVVVNGEIYNVKFSGDACITAFNGCTSNDDFTFHTATDAIAASTALLEQVFVDLPGHALDSNPFLTKGISANSYNLAWVITPYEINGKGIPGLVLAQVMRNSTLEYNDWSDFCDCGYRNNQELQATETYAVWSVGEVSAVPVPAALPLMASGIAAVGFASRRRKSA